MAVNHAKKLMQEAIVSWEVGDRVYGIRHDPERNYPWVLEHAGLTGVFGGTVPFKTAEELEEHMRVRGLKAPSGWHEGQMTLGI